MQRVAVFEDTKCPYRQLLQKVDSHKNNNGRLEFDLKRTVWCRKTDGICLGENCPLPKLPDIDYSTKTLPLDDYTGNYDDAYELGWERGQEAIIDAITGGTP